MIVRIREFSDKHMFLIIDKKTFSDKSENIEKLEQFDG